jgi:hypothetical protein
MLVRTEKWEYFCLMIFPESISHEHAFSMDGSWLKHKPAVSW